MQLRKKSQLRSLLVLGVLVIVSFVLNFLSKKAPSVSKSEELMSLIPEAKADDGVIAVTACCTTGCTGF